MMSQDAPAKRRPTIFVTRADHRALTILAGTGDHSPPGALLLREELDRAVVVDEGELPQSFARLGSAVTYEDLSAQRVRTVRLVLPDEADIDAGRVSVFSPVGAALLGLTTGAVFTMDVETPRARALRIVEIVNREGLA